VDAGVCDAETLDTVVKQGFGARLGVIGPLEQADLGGLELTHQIHKVVMPALDNTPEPHPLLVQKIERGEIGAKVGQGFRSWSDGEADALRAQVNRTLLEQARRRMARPDSGPAIGRSGTAERRFGLGGLLIFLTDAEAASRTDALIDARLRRGSSVPLHRHPTAGEALVVLDGELGLELDGDAVALAAGDSAQLPPGTSCSWRVASDYARVLIFAEPERAGFYRALSRSATGAGDAQAAVEPDDISLSDAAEKSGVELLPPVRGA
jgi:quercetin dioxygenase-like cupin family protein